MDPVSTSTVRAASPILPPAPQPAATDAAVDAPSHPPVDTVTLSPEAQDILEGRAPPPAPSAPATPPSQDAIAAAVAALNDTTGQTSLDDQLKAYGLISQVVAKGQVLIDNRLPPAAPPPGGMISASDAAALLASSFSQRLAQVVASVDNRKAPGAADDGDPAKLTGAALDAFNALSADDQAIYGAAQTVFRALGGAVPASPASPRAYSASDAKAVMDALARVDDTTGGVMAKDLVAAQKLLDGFAAGGPGPAGLAVVTNAQASPFAARAAQDRNLVDRYLVPGQDPYPQILDHLNALSPEDQATYFGTSNTAPDGTVLFASLDSLKENLGVRETMLQVYTAVTKTYGVSDLAHFTTRAQKDNASLQQLENLFRMDQGNDGWTAMAKDFLSHTSWADLGLAPADANGDPDMAKAMATLQEVKANQTAFVLAAKSGHLHDWRAVVEGKKSKDKVDAETDDNPLTTA